MNHPDEMQTPTLSLSGLEYYTLRDFERLFWRRKWLIVFATLGIALVTAIITYFVPNVYKATTVILVDPRKVPDSYVKSTVSTDVVDRLTTLQEQILSETRLSQIIDEMGLYASLNKPEPLDRYLDELRLAGRSKRGKSREEIIDQMRKEIDIKLESNGSRGLGAFSISYRSRNPVEAARVTNRLASLFIEENIKAREQQVLGTSDFLTRELEEAKKGLDQKESEIRQLKTRFVSDLPESQGVHVQAISSLQLALREEMDAISRAEEQKVSLQMVVANTPHVVNLDADSSQASPELAGLQALLSREQGELDQLRKRYGPGYPDVIKKSNEIQDLESRLEKVKPAAKPLAHQPAPPVQYVNPVIQSQMTKLDDDIIKHQAREDDIKNQIAYHESKLEKIPLIEQQMASVMREYDVARQEYMRLLDGKFAADMSSDLEVRQKAERFVPLDPAQVPEKPDSPNRPLINLLGLGAGLMIALAGTVALELTDHTVKTEREAITLAGTEVFGEIPWLPTQGETRRRVFTALLAGTGSTVLAACYAFLFYWTWR